MRPEAPRGREGGPEEAPGLVRRRPFIAARQVGQRYLVVKIKEQRLLLLNAVGGRICDLAAVPIRTEAIAAAVAAEFAGPAARIRAEVAAFVADLVARGVLEPVAEEAGDVGL